MDEDLKARMKLPEKVDIYLSHGDGNKVLLAEDVILHWENLQLPCGHSTTEESTIARVNFTNPTAVASMGIYCSNCQQLNGYNLEFVKK